MQSLNIMDVNNSSAIKLEEWDLRMDSDQFENWLKERKIFKFFFDGASKGNPGKAGGVESLLILMGRSRLNTAETLVMILIIWLRRMGSGKVSSSCRRKEWMRSWSLVIPGLLFRH